jgi:hypothetical protein
MIRLKMTNESEKKKNYETMAICEKYVIIRVEKILSQRRYSLGK